jgi:hypothetical protein
MHDTDGRVLINIVIPSEAEEPAFSLRRFDLPYEGALCPSTKN